MSNKYTAGKRCLNFGHLVFALALGVFPALLAVPYHRAPSRAPANYVPNDDVIVVPVDAEVSFYEKHVLDDKNWSDKSQVQRQIRIWQENELMAQQYRMDTQSGAYYVPTSQEKWIWFQKNYMRYLQKKGEKPLQETSQAQWREWTANDEVNSIDEMEAAFKATNKRGATGKPLPGIFREKQAKVQKFRFQVQPRVEQGLMIIKASGGYVGELRAWVGVSGRAEVNYQKSFSTGTRIMWNYYALTGQYLSALDQNLGNGFSVRGTSSRSPSGALDRRVQLNFGSQF